MHAKPYALAFVLLFMAALVALLRGQPAIAQPSIRSLDTPTPTPEVRCPDDRFKDVCASDHFYQHVLDLNDLGVISGYTASPPCRNEAEVPCFLPSNTTTRGQIAKIVSLAAGFNEPTNNQTFEDVSPTHTFYSYVERMYQRGIISGYACGGPGEPCGEPTQRPYFRPGSSVTRGQLTKMATLAFGFDEPVTGRTFEDVLPGDTFHVYVERLASRDIIGGYPCGMAEPCVPPNNRPYFRPGNEVNRGQIVKIVNLARLQQEPTPTPSPGPTCDNVPPAVNMSISPSNCAPAGTTFTFVGSGFTPGEGVGVYFIAPDGSVFGAPYNLTTDENGVTEPIDISPSPDIPRGLWTMIMYGLSSQSTATGYFRILEP